MVSEGEDDPLFGGQAADGGPDDDHVLGRTGDGAGCGARAVAQLQQRAPGQRPVLVDQDPAGVHGRVVETAAAPPAEGAHEGVLGQLLGAGAVAGEQIAEPAQATELGREELAELRLFHAHAATSGAVRSGRCVSLPAGPEWFQLPANSSERAQSGGFEGSGGRVREVDRARRLARSVIPRPAPISMEPPGTRTPQGDCKGGPGSRDRDALPTGGGRVGRQRERA